MSSKKECCHCQSTFEENSELKDKIEKSKPILSTIYDKIKKKEQLLIHKIGKEKKSYSEYKKSAANYKKLYEDSIQIMQKGGLFSKFEGSATNFIETVPRMGQTPKIKSKSIYEQYLERIDKSKIEVELLNNEEIKNLRKENEHLSNEMLEDINRLKLVRYKSQPKLGKPSQFLLSDQLKMSKTSKTEAKHRLASLKRDKLSQII